MMPPDVTAWLPGSHQLPIIFNHFFHLPISPNHFCARFARFVQQKLIGRWVKRPQPIEREARQGGGTAHSMVHRRRVGRGATNARGGAGRGEARRGAWRGAGRSVVRPGLGAGRSVVRPGLGAGRGVVRPGLGARARRGEARRGAGRGAAGARGEAGRREAAGSGRLCAIDHSNRQPIASCVTVLTVECSAPMLHGLLRLPRRGARNRTIWVSGAAAQGDNDSVARADVPIDTVMARAETTGQELKRSRSG
jgi:hypothetical protein